HAAQNQQQFSQISHVSSSGPAPRSIYAAFSVPLPGSLAASTSAFSIVGGWESKSPAFAMSAAATLPLRCACRPASSGNASKIPKVEGPSGMPNQATVDDSCCTSAKPLVSKLATSPSFPGLP